MSSVRNALVSLAVLFVLVPDADAQIGSGTDIIMGRVIRPDRTSLAGARVRISSLVTGAERQATTGPDGRFTVLFRDGGGQYRLTATFVGMQPSAVTARRYGNEDRLVVTIQMSAGPQQLERVEVRERADAFETAFKAGGSERTLTPQFLQRLPVHPGDLYGAALLVPGVLAAAASDTSRAAFSVIAQPPVQNNVTLDGMTFLFGSIPQEAISAIRLFSNSYDVSRGQFTGGQLATTTRAGTSRREVEANFSYRPAALQTAGAAGPFAQTFSHLLASGGLAGPVPGARRAFYAMSAEVQRREHATMTLQSARAANLQRLGVHPDTLVRFESALRQLGAERTSERARKHALLEAAGLARFDFDLTPNNQLLVRADLRGSAEQAVRVSPYATNGTDGDANAVGGGVMAMLGSVMGKFIHELRAYSSWERHQSDPTVRGASGIVMVTSAIDGRNEITALQFGGSQALPRLSRATLQEANSELSFLTEDGAHRWKIGIMVNRERAEIIGINDRYGAYIYNSLTDLEANTPSMFTRTLPGAGRLIGTDNGALYLANAWRQSARLHVTYGFRMEASRLAESPPANAFVAAVFSRQTRNFLSELRMYPRFGLTYLFGDESAEPTATLGFGIGEFRGRIPSHLLQYVNTNDGFASDSQMVCVGNFIPAPDWSRFNADTVRIPRDCVVSSRLPLGEVKSNAAFWGQSAGAPRSWRLALNLEKRLGARFRLGVNALYAHGVHNPAAVDQNLVRHPQLVRPLPVVPSLSNEPRPFYPHPAAVIPSTGAVSLSGSRHYPFFATAFDLNSGVSSRAGQLTMELAAAGQSIGFATLDQMSVAYTFTRARDESNGYPFQSNYATTAGDPSIREWGTSDFERRHSVLSSAVMNLPRSLELGLIGRVVSGPRYTPMVAGDANGDGFRNDRAFIFPPGSPEGDALQRMLGVVDDRARTCITSQLGRIAQRNSCTTRWQAMVDLQLRWRRTDAQKRHITVSLGAYNVLDGVDALFHADAVKGWGQPLYPDHVLMKVDSFDPDALTFSYSVNERFGTRTGAASPFRVPFQLGLHVRLATGTP